MVVVSERFNCNIINISMKAEFLKGYVIPSSELIEVVAEQSMMTMSYNGTIEDGQLDNWGEM